MRKNLSLLAVLSLLSTLLFGFGLPSRALAFVPPPPLLSLVFTQQPAGPAVAGAPLAIQPVVTLLDSQGNTDTGWPFPVILTADHGDLTCDNNNTASPMAGVATFSGCSLAADGDYTLTAQTAFFIVSASVTSDSFHVGPVAPPVVLGKPVNIQTPRSELTGAMQMAPKVNGHSIPGETVHISIANQVVGTATVDSTSKWLYDFGSLPDGDYVASVDINGGGDSFTFTVDTKAPAVLMSSRTATNETRPTLTGTAEVGSTVRIYLDGELVATTQPDGKGNWSVELPKTADGKYALKVVATDKAGNEGVAQQSTLTVKTTKPELSTEALPALAAGQTQPVSGQAEPGARIELWVNSGLSGWATAGADGSWRATLPGLMAGHYVLQVQATDAAGNVTATDWLDLTVSPSQP